MSEEKLITFEEFAQACAKEGHPLYKGFPPTAFPDVRQYFFHALTVEVLPNELDPRWDFEKGRWDDSNVARLPKKKWHLLYAQALEKLLDSRAKGGG